jgi:exopolyphosphatase/guanosine-5'-triphosphate,3'-diphosphate pyrophosphatase
MTESQRFLPGELAHRLAAIDIGTNSIRMVVAEGIRGGAYRILDEERVSTRLGRALQDTGRLDEQSIKDSLAALGRFQQIIDGFNVDQQRTIATCAVREAANGREFCDLVRDELGIDIEIISSQKEAHLAFHSVQRSFDLSGKNIVLADIGGGSTEIVLASGNLIEAIFPTDLGTVRLSEIYGSGQAMIGDDYDRLIEGIDRRLKKQTKRAGFQSHFLIGSGGTFTSLASMVMARKNQQGLPVRGYEVSRAELKHLLDQLRKIPPKDRRSTPGLNPDRADIIVAGLAIIDRVMRRFKVNMLQVHNRGVRDGLLLTMIERLTGGERGAVDRDAAIDRLAAACGTEMEHGRQVAILAGQIFDQLAEPESMREEDRALLEAASRLQDVGYLINYDQHHKHSYHLILNSRMVGFQPHERELIANVARYHRGAEPKKKHANFRQLASEDRQRVRQLAAILRLAGGLDRSHSQQVTGVTLQRVKEDTELVVHAKAYPDVDLWGARRRAGMFEKAFDTTLSIRWSGDEPESENGQPIEEEVGSEEVKG